MAIQSITAFAEKDGTVTDLRCLVDLYACVIPEYTAVNYKCTFKEMVASTDEFIAHQITFQRAAVNEECRMYHSNLVATIKCVRESFAATSTRFDTTYRQQWFIQLFKAKTVWVLATGKVYTGGRSTYRLCRFAECGDSVSDQVRIPKIVGNPLQWLRKDETGRYQLDQAGFISAGIPEVQHAVFHGQKALAEVHKHLLGQSSPYSAATYWGVVVGLFAADYELLQTIDGLTLDNARVVMLRFANQGGRSKDVTLSLRYVLSEYNTRGEKVALDRRQLMGSGRGRGVWWMGLRVTGG